MFIVRQWVYGLLLFTQMNGMGLVLDILFGLSRRNNGVGLGVKMAFGPC